MWSVAHRLLAFAPPREVRVLRWWMVGAALLVLADLAAITLVAFAVSALTGATAAGLNAPWSPGVGLALAAAILLVRGLGALGVQRGTFRALSDIECSLAARLTDGYLHAPWLWVRARSSPRAMLLAETGVSKAAGAFIAPLYASVPAVVGVVAISILVVVWNPAVAIGAVVYGALMAWLLFRVLSPRVQHAGQASFDAEHQLQAGVSRVWQAAAEIRVFGLSDVFAADLDLARRKRADAFASASALGAAPQFVMEIALVGGLGLVALAAVAVGRGEAALTVVAVLAVVSLRLLPSLLRLQGGATSVRHNVYWANQLLEELEALADLPRTTTSEVTAPAPVRTTAGELLVQFQGVGLTYPGRQTPVLSGVDLELRAGDRIGVVGPSGSGKSTLAGLILGLLDPGEGRAVRVPIRTALLAQETTVLDGSLRDNLVFERATLADVPTEVLMSALADAGLAAEVAAMPDGLDTLVGERGAALSGGQRQRLGLARALLGSPDLLVLDEPTSHLDDDNATWVRDALARLESRVAVVLVTHRIEMLAGFETILTVETGRVIQTGAGT